MTTKPSATSPSARTRATARATSPPSRTSRLCFPFIEEGIDHDGVLRDPRRSGRWPSRLLRVAYTVRLLLLLLSAQGRVGRPRRSPPGLLSERAVAIERRSFKDAGADGDASYEDLAMQGRAYTWSGGETLSNCSGVATKFLRTTPRPLLAQPNRAATFPWFKSWPTRSTKTTLRTHALSALYR